MAPGRFLEHADKRNSWKFIDPARNEFNQTQMTRLREKFESADDQKNNYENEYLKLLNIHTVLNLI